MKKIIFFLCSFICFSSAVFAAPTYFNYKKEAFTGSSQINFAGLDMKNLKEVELTFVGMEFNAQGFADFVAIDKPVTLYASCSTDLRVRYKNRPSYEYDTIVNKKEVHFNAKNYFYWNSYLQLKLLPDRKHGTKLRCKFNGIENTLSSYIIEKAADKENSRTFKFLNRVKNRSESLDFYPVSDFKEIPAPLKYCASNLMCCRFNVHFGSGKPLFGKGKPNEVKDVTITFFATIQALNFNDDSKVTYKTEPKPMHKEVVVVAEKTETKDKTDNKKNASKKKSKGKTKATSKTKTADEAKSVSEVKTETASAGLSGKELAPRTDAELDDDLVAEVVFVTGAENSLINESSIAPRTDSQLDDDLVGD